MADQRRCLLEEISSSQGDVTEAVNSARIREWRIQHLAQEKY